MVGTVCVVFRKGGIVGKGGSGGNSIIVVISVVGVVVKGIGRKKIVVRFIRIAVVVIIMVVGIKVIVHAISAVRGENGWKSQALG